VCKKYDILIMEGKSSLYGGDAEVGADSVDDPYCMPNLPSGLGLSTDPDRLPRRGAHSFLFRAGTSGLP
jgi:hypothetical protein